MDLAKILTVRSSLAPSLEGLGNKSIAKAISIKTKINLNFLYIKAKVNIPAAKARKPDLE